MAAKAQNSDDYITLLLTQVETEKDGKSKIKQCLQLISRLYAIANKLALTEVELKSIKESPSAYNINSLTQLTIENIQTLYKFKQQLVDSFNQPEEKLLDYLKNASSIETLAKFTGQSQEQIALLPYLKVSQGTEIKETKEFIGSVEGLLKLKQCFDLSATLGCNIDFLCQLCDLNEPVFGSILQQLLEPVLKSVYWDLYQQLAQSVTSLVKAKYNDEEWAKVFGKLNGSLEERKCQVLREFALHKFGMENLRQLSEYLLLDVEMTSCSCNSPIQLAILSLQTYLQRCRMGFELGVSKVEIPDVWWEWIMNYRKWEANRKVFLYPENYIDPSLRKNASPIFKELQDELLQSDITADSVETAYRNYFDKFAEIAKLQIVESCRYQVTTPKSPEPIDTLFLFGKTITEPRTYFYRHCEHPEAEKPHWGYWQKIDLQINSDYLASVYAFNRLFISGWKRKRLRKIKINQQLHKQQLSIHI
ncbi:MAG: neuraminidase-like domain-containing protein [Cyanobacteria bacterium J06643_5]